MQAQYDLPHPSVSMGRPEEDAFVLEAAYVINPLEISAWNLRAVALIVQVLVRSIVYGAFGRRARMTGRRVGICSDSEVGSQNQR